MCALEDIRDKLLSWARSEALIGKVYLFGGCAKGRFPNVSDIDIAVELLDCGDDDETYSAWSGASRRFREKLESLNLPRKVDLQWYGGPVATPNIHEYILEKSELLYDAAT